MKQYKEIIVSMNKGDVLRRSGYKFFSTKENIENYLKDHGNDKVICICTTDPSIISNELFDKGFNFIVTNDFKEYLAQGNRKKFVKLYHHNDKVSLIWSSFKKLVVKDDIYIDNIKKWIFHMYNFA